MTDHPPYDLIAIGGGSGGLAVVRRAAAHGARCALIERDALGGTCVNRGCVPKKMLWYAAEAGVALHRAAALGWGDVATTASFDWAAMQQRCAAYIQRLNGIYSRALEQASVDVINGSAHFVDAHTVQVAGRHYQARNIVIACGGRPRWPDIPGAQWGLVSDHFFTLPQQPRRVAIVGGGYIAVELAGLLRAFGSEVHLCIRRQQVLAGFDSMLRQAAQQHLVAAGVHIWSECVLEALHKAGSKRRLQCQKAGPTGDFDAVFWALGRQAESASLAAEKAGLVCDEEGYIGTDAAAQTAIEGIFVIGDANKAQAPLTPVAIAAGRRLAEHLFGHEPLPLAATVVPSVVFAHPPLATAGLSEQAAKSRYGAAAIRVYQSCFTPLSESLLPHPAKAAIKLLTEGATERVIGCHICAPQADEILQGMAVAMEMGVTLADLERCVAIHPTLAEELLSLR